MYKILDRMIEQNNFKSIEDFRNKIDVFFGVEPARLTSDEYKELNDKINAKQDNIAYTQA